MLNDIETVLVTGGAGYVGSVLVPELLNKGYKVKVLDLYLYGEEVFDAIKGHRNLIHIKGDLRDTELLSNSLEGCDAVIHLACISNDPSFELDKELGKSINYDAFIDLVKISKSVGVKRFVYASSSSVYGIKDIPNVTEDLNLEPLTDYSKYKAMCEEVLLKETEPGFTSLIVRPATVCGYSPRLRLDLAVNILTNHAVTNREIKVFGGKQMRPNIHIKDMVNFYLNSLDWDDVQINGKIYNVGYHNHTVSQIADIVKGVIGDDVKIVTTPTDDNRSYHVSSEKIKQELGFKPKFSIEHAVKDLNRQFISGKIVNSMTNNKYYNIRLMQDVNLS